MKKIYLIIYSLFLIHFSFGQGGTWTQKANYGGGARYGAIGFSIGAKGYFGSGLDSAINLTNDFWEYDTVTNAWTQKADIGTLGRFGAVGFAVGNYGYVGLGTTSYPSYVWSTDFWQYDPTSNTWTQKGNFPGSGRYAISFFTIGNKGYIGGGWGYNDFWEYNPANDTWTQLTNIGGSARESGTGFAINDKGYVTLGLDGNSPLNDLWEYDTLANTWTQKASFPGTARFAATAFVLCNYAYVGLGSSNYPTEVELNDFWRYDPSADSWTQIVSFQSSARNGAVDFVIGDNAYVGTGAASTALSGFTTDLWEFNADSCNAIAVVPPVASFQSSDTSLCANGCVNFTDLSTNATSWQWRFSGAADSTSTAENPQNVCYLVPGIYNVTLITSNAAGSDTLTFGNYINVKAIPPTPVITQVQDTVLYCKTNPSYTSYQWFYDSTLIYGATDTTLIIAQNGNYNVRVTNANECAISAGINIVLGIQNYVSDNIISVYPNPVSKTFTVYGLQFIPNAFGTRIEIYNVLGQAVQHSPLFWRGVGGEADVSCLPSGIYFVQIANDSGSWVGKFVKE